MKANEKLRRVLKGLNGLGSALDSAIELARDEGVDPNPIWVMKKSLGRLAKIHDNLTHIQGLLPVTRPETEEEFDIEF